MDSHTVSSRIPLGSEVELLTRRRPPGSVDLAHGQQEHVLMCTYGTPLKSGSISSELQTESARHEWSTCPNGHITFIPAGLAMQWNWSYDSESVHVTMLPSFLSGFAADFEKSNSDPPSLKPFFRVFDNSLLHLVHELRQESVGDKPGKDLITSSLMMLIASRIYRQSDALPAGNHQKGLSAADQRKLNELLNDRLNEKIPLSELADEFGLSQYHFARLFKQATGFPPHEYQIQLRISRARKLLVDRPHAKIADIACELGFTDESHFRRHFRRIVGVTPSQFRDQQ